MHSDRGWRHRVVPRTRRRRRVLVHALRAVVVRRRGLRVDRRRRACAPSRPGRRPGATPSWWMPTPNIGDGRADWIVRDAPTRPSAFPTATGWSTRGSRARSSGATRGSRCGTCTRSGGRRPRGRPPPPVPAALRTRCRRTGACRRASGDRTWLRSATHRATAGGKAAITFGNAGLRYYDGAGAVLPHTVDTWAVPVGAVRVDGISVAVSWGAQGWGLSPANTTFSASCTRLRRPTRRPTPPEPHSRQTEDRTDDDHPRAGDLVRRDFGLIADNVEHAVLGKRHVVELVLTAMLSDGHVLLEDVPGTGKTSLARALGADDPGHQHAHPVHSRPAARRHHRHHGVRPEERRFEFHAGPIFANIVLADEINRASPKTQSALLEVMEEGNVTIDGVTRPVGEPFLVIATQNPVEQAGTYRLPEAQLDRFMMHDLARLPRRRGDRPHPRGRRPSHGRAHADHHPAPSSPWPISPRGVYVNPLVSTTSCASSTPPAGRRGAPGCQRPRRPRADQARARARPRRGAPT